MRHTLGPILLTAALLALAGCRSFEAGAHAPSVFHCTDRDTNDDVFEMQCEDNTAER